MLPTAVSLYLESQRPQYLAKLFELLRIPSIANRDDDGCPRAAQWLADHLASLGLSARVCPTEGKPAVLAELHVDDAAPTLLIYGHYDVQPPEPLELWQSPAFEPQIRDGCIYARGANDDKGQLFTHLMAIEAWQRAGGPPVNLKLFIEGEEEVGSPSLEAFLAAHGSELAADAAVISDSSFFAEGHPSITYALRGLAYVELTLRGPNRDIHSGLYGGAVANPVNGLARIIAALHDANGRVTIEGFYDDVRPLTSRERQAWEALGYDAAADAADLGVSCLGGGEADLPALERLWARPTLDCNGIVGGYTGAGSKTIIPAQASAKISMRLVADQCPEKIIASLRRFVAERTPAGLTAELAVYAASRPVVLATDTPAMAAARSAMAAAFGTDATLIRCGASVPVTELFQRLLGLDAVLMGFGLPADRLHSPNERFALGQLYRGAEAAAMFMQNLAEKSA